MAKDDFLVIYTDGVSEATNLRGELLGDVGLRKIIQDFSGENVDELAELIRHGVQAFTGGAPQSDDITLLVIQYRGSGAMNASSASGKDECLAAAALDAALRAIQTEAAPAELAAQIAALVAVAGWHQGRAHLA